MQWTSDPEGSSLIFMFREKTISSSLVDTLVVSVQYFRCFVVVVVVDIVIVVVLSLLLLLLLFFVNSASVLESIVYHL